MLKNVPKILSPELLKVLAEMGHSDVIVLGDGNFPGKRFAIEGGAKFLRADGHGVPELMDAILEMIPMDAYVETPITLMDKMECDKALEIPIWEEYINIAKKHDSRGSSVVGFIDRFEFYERAKSAYCIVQTGEEAIYANVMIQKGVIK